jgi:phosphopantothenoylcysteine decarboxylase/phosphopantothenate--cysteine ligase
MAEPENIVQILQQLFTQHLPLQGKHLLLTAGPTFEAIDPVRFIGNRSSGKMGIALAEAAAAQGATVDLILGPTWLAPSNPDIRVYPVESARQMHEAALQLFPKADVAIMAAAVADYRPQQYHDQKLKKQGEAPLIHLVENPDIAASLGQQKQAHQILVGFALETQDALNNARKKREKKNLDLIILNSLQDAGAGFNHDTNRITIIDQDNNLTEFALKSKQAVAKDILAAVIHLLNQAPG